MTALRTELPVELIDSLVKVTINQKILSMAK
jgi:hypothetical protein